MLSASLDVHEKVNVAHLLLLPPPLTPLLMVLLLLPLQQDRSSPAELDGQACGYAQMDGWMDGSFILPVPIPSVPVPARLPLVCLSILLLPKSISTINQFEGCANVCACICVRPTR